MIVAGPKPCVNKSPTKLQIMITEKGKEKGRLLETQNLCSRVQLLRYSCFADEDKDAWRSCWLDWLKCRSARLALLLASSPTMGQSSWLPENSCWRLLSRLALFKSIELLPLDEACSCVSAIGGAACSRHCLLLLLQDGCCQLVIVDERVAGTANWLWGWIDLAYRLYRRTRICNGLTTGNCRSATSGSLWCLCWWSGFRSWGFFFSLVALCSTIGA